VAVTLWGLLLGSTGLECVSGYRLFGRFVVLLILSCRILDRCPFRSVACSSVVFVVPLSDTDWASGWETVKSEYHFRQFRDNSNVFTGSGSAVGYIGLLAFWVSGIFSGS